MKKILIIPMLALLGTACSTNDTSGRACNDGNETNSLAGSYCEDVDINYSEVKLLRVASSLRIEYVRPTGTGSEKALQIILSGENVTLEPNVSIGLIEAGAVIRRLVPDAPAPISLTEELEETSSLMFMEYTGVIGTPARGEFGMLFKSGRTLRGEFEGTIEDAVPHE